MLNECIAFYRPGQDVSARATVNLTGKRLCAITGNRESGPGLSSTADGGLYRVGLPTLGGRVFGVVGYDVSSGGSVPVKREGVLPCLAAANIAAEQEVEVTADGRIQPVTTGHFAIGVVHTAVLAGADAELELYKGPVLKP